MVSRRYPQGGVTLQLSWTSKTNPWALTLFFQVKCTIFWLNRGLRVHLDLYAPDFPKTISKYLYFTKVVRKHGSRCFTAMSNFLMQYLYKELFWAMYSFKLVQTHMLNVFLTKLSFFLANIYFTWLGWFLLPKNTPK